ncbi:hypothetical protein I4U23_000157 [Adineta vaga]|nr:hypothetical protein I4U23_000157 [Adineta vaga]
MTSLNEATIYEIIMIHLNSVGRGIIIVLGTFGGIMNLYIFAQRTMRKNPFSIYLIAFNISNLCYIWLSLFPLFLNQIFNINPTTYNLSYCRFYYYLSYTLNIICPSFLILASIDRVLISSPNALTRQKSTRRLAFISLILVTFLWFIYYCQYLFRINMHILFGPTPSCYFDLGDYSLYVNYSAIVLGLVPPILLSICALKTFQNLHRDRYVEAIS